MQTAQIRGSHMAFPADDAHLSLSCAVVPAGMRFMDYNGHEDLEAMHAQSSKQASQHNRPILVWCRR